MMVLTTSGNFCPNPNIPVVSRTTVVINPANKTGIVIGAIRRKNSIKSHPIRSPINRF